MHAANYEAGHFSNEFIDLVTRMLAVNPEQRLSIAEIIQHPWMQQKDLDPADVAKFCDTFASNETSCTTASSAGESNARIVINENQQRVRGTFEVDQEEDEQPVGLTMDVYNPLIHKTTHVVNNMNEVMLLELLECMFGCDEDLASTIKSISREKGVINISVDETKEKPPMSLEVKLIQK